MHYLAVRLIGYIEEGGLVQVGGFYFEFNARMTKELFCIADLSWSKAGLFKCSYLLSFTS